MAYRLALASNDGETVDQHFGHARRFIIVDLDGDTYEKAEIRTVQTEYAGFGCGACAGSRGPAASMEEKFSGALEAITDCQGVFVTQIGASAAHFLLKRGIRVFQVFGSLDEIMDYVIQNRLLEEGGI